MTMPAASMILIRPLWLPSVGQNSKKIIGAEGRSRIGVKTSLVVFGAGFSVMMAPSLPSKGFRNAACSTIGFETRAAKLGGTTKRAVLKWRAGIQKKGPAAMGPPGSLGGNARHGAPDGDATSNGRPMLTLSDQGRGPSSASPNFNASKA